MKILYDKTRENFIAYHMHYSSKKKAPCIIFHHGLMSNMNGTKAVHIEEYCKENDYNFIRFDNFGHGNSSGNFTNQTITSWLAGLNLVIDKLTNHAPILLIGSSMGGWITMLRAIKSPDNLIGMIGISSAPDFTEELIWDKLTEAEKETLMHKGIVEIIGEDSKCNQIYPMNLDLITDARNYLLLNKKHIEIKCPVHLIHGTKDTDVPFTISMRAYEKITSEEIILKLIKNANHSLSRTKDLQIICNSIKEILD